MFHARPALLVAALGSLFAAGCAGPGCWGGGWGGGCWRNCPSRCAPVSDCGCECATSGLVQGPVLDPAPVPTIPAPANAYPRFTPAPVQPAPPTLNVPQRLVPQPQSQPEAYRPTVR